MIRGSLLEKVHCSAIPGDCCSAKRRAELPLAASLVQIYTGTLTEFVCEQSLTALYNNYIKLKKLVGHQGTPEPELLAQLLL